MASCEAFAAAGATICFNCSSEGSKARALEAYKANGVDAHGYVCDVCDEEAVKALVAQIKEANPDKEFKSFEFKVDGEYVDVNYTYDMVPFERIRRITGYLVGTIDRFNDAKAQEVRDRTKNGLVRNL